MTFVASVGAESLHRKSSLPHRGPDARIAPARRPRPPRRDVRLSRRFAFDRAARPPPASRGRWRSPRATADYAQEGNAAATVIDDGDGARLRGHRRVAQQRVPRGTLARPRSRGAQYRFSRRGPAARSPSGTGASGRRSKPGGDFRSQLSADADAARDLDLPTAVARVPLEDRSAAPPTRIALSCGTASGARQRDGTRPNAPREAPRATMPVVPTAFVLKSAEPRLTRLRLRGAYTSPAERVTPGVPAVLPPLEQCGGDASVTPDRLALARWIASPPTRSPRASPSTASGSNSSAPASSPLRKTSAPPASIPPTRSCWITSPCAFPRDEMERQIHAARVGHQRHLPAGSRPSPPIWKTRCPGNRLLPAVRASRFTAEMMRDHSLTAAGLISPRSAALRVQPPLPPGVWKPFTANEHLEPGDPERYRRAVYTYWRSLLYPLLSPSTCLRATSRPSAASFPIRRSRRSLRSTTRLPRGRHRLAERRPRPIPAALRLALTATASSPRAKSPRTAARALRDLYQHLVADTRARPP